MFAWGLPILSGLADASSRVIIKTTNIPSFILNGIGFLSALPFYAAWLLFLPFSVTNENFWLVIAAHVPLMVLAFALTVKAHRSSTPFILTAPFLSFTTLFLLVMTPLMGGPLTNEWGIIGVSLITMGAYVLNMKAGKMGLWEPFRQFRRERGSQLMLIVAFVFSITANFDYLGFTYANAPTYLLVDHGLVGISCLVIAILLSFLKKPAGEAIGKKKLFLICFLYGFALALSVIPHMLAFEWISNVPYVIAGKRAGVILFTVALGIFFASTKKFGERYIEERRNLQYRIPGVLLMTMGMTLIITMG